jgi:hypothetical protein
MFDARLSRLDAGKRIQQNRRNQEEGQTMTNDERMQRDQPDQRVRRMLPDFATMWANDKEPVLLHQDAFAADYQEDEYTLPAWRSNISTS